MKAPIYTDHFTATQNPNDVKENITAAHNPLHLGNGDLETAKETTVWFMPLLIGLENYHHLTNANCL